MKSVKVLILPMRNGNEEGMAPYEKSGISSYPTYEEWKPIKFRQIFDG